MRNRSSALGVSVLVLGLIVVGCGDSSEGSGGGQASLREVNADCRAGNEKVASDIKKGYRLAKPETEKEEIKLEVSVLVPALIGLAETELVSISDLEVPRGDEAEVEAILDAYRKWIAKAKGTPFKVVVANDVYNEARERAGKYGLSECATSPFEVE